MEKEKVMTKEEWLEQVEKINKCLKAELDFCNAKKSCHKCEYDVQADLLAEAKKIFEAQIEEEKMRNLLIGLQLGHIENSVSDVQLKRIKEYTQNIENILLNGVEKYE